MSYDIYSIGSNIRLNESHAKYAMNAIKQKVKYGVIKYCDAQAVLECTSFREVMKELDYSVTPVFDDDCLEVKYYTEFKRLNANSGDDKDILATLAPFVNDNSYIEMVGEEGEHWRWILHTDGSVKKKYPKYVYD